MIALSRSKVGARAGSAAILTAAEEDLVKQATALAADHVGPGPRPQTRRSEL